MIYIYMQEVLANDKDGNRPASSMPVVDILSQ